MPSPAPASLPKTLGELRRSAEFSESRIARRGVKQEVRENLVRKMQAGEPLFPGIVGFEDTVEPQIINALLSRHDFILLGLRGQAKSRILRQLTGLLDPQLPYLLGTEVNDDPYHPISKQGREIIETQGDDAN